MRLPFSSNNLFGINHCSADLPDDDTGRRVGQSRGIGQRASAAKAAAVVAATVSPAPETSNTSRARAGRWCTASCETNVIPRSLRVASTADIPAD